MLIKSYIQTWNTHIKIILFYSDVCMIRLRILYYIILLYNYRISEILHKENVIYLLKNRIKYLTMVKIELLRCRDCN